MQTPTSPPEAEEEEEEEDGCWVTYGRRGGERQLPPAIPMLARTGNLPCRMPWVLERTYREDGSLVIKEVRVTKHHEFFRARRENGRLTLRLVHLDEGCPLFSKGQREEGKEEDAATARCGMISIGSSPIQQVMVSRSEPDEFIF